MNTDPEQALLQLQAEELAVGNTQGCAAGAAEVGGQQGLRVVPGPRAPFELPHVVVIGTCVKISDDINTGSYGYGSINKRGTGGDA